MIEKRDIKDYLTKKNFLKFLRNFGLTFLLISPIVIFFLGMMLFQLSIPNAKDPFVQWCGYDPKTEAVITWETEELESSIVWYGIDQNNLNQNKTDNTLAVIHRVVLTDLNPDTIYYYRVGTVNPEFVYRSEVFSFKTAPNNTITEFSFAMYADSQQFYGIGWHKLICDAIARHNDLSFVAHAGDLCQNWDYKPDWNQFFSEASAYMRKYPFAPVMGNHDGYYPEDDPEGTLHYYAQYFPPTSESNGDKQFYYSFNWSNTLFIAAEISKAVMRIPP